MIRCYSNFLTAFRARLHMILLAGICTMMIVLPGCASVKGYWDLDANLKDYSYKAAEQLVERAVPPIAPEQAILVASLVNINNIETSSAFGRTISEQMASRLTQMSYRIIQMKLRKSVYMKRSEGELFLSREVYAISNEQKAQYVLVGTYSEANIVVYVNVSIVRLSDSRVVASYDYEVPLGANNRKLLQE
ncbi:MAG: hypothetical protein GXX82_10485 [Syntrophorhabdus sp.]|nr:hypothetical protein [Syntrophorhabdus sp.]